MLRFNDNKLKLSLKLSSTKGFSMKNSPHRHKHQVNKAVRQASKTHPLPIKPSPDKMQADITLEHNKLVRVSDKLKPINKKVSLEILTVYKKHFERAKHIAKPKHSKRSTPGMIEGESPFTHIRHHMDIDLGKKIRPSLQKSSAIARKVIKNQNNRRAA